MHSFSLNFARIYLSIGRAQLSLFCQEFEYSEGRQLGSSLARMRNAQLIKSFQFFVNGTVRERSVSESATLFAAVREQLLVDGCARKFFFQVKRFQMEDHKNC
jgi:hypothetical protein